MTRDPEVNALARQAVQHQLHSSVPALLPPHLNIDAAGSTPNLSSAFLCPSDINLAGEPKPHRSKTTKRSAGEMYRSVENKCNWISLIVCELLSRASALTSPLFILCSSSSFELDYDFQRDYYDRWVDCLGSVLQGHKSLCWVSLLANAPFNVLSKRDKPV